MAGKQTFTMIKPSTFAANHTGAILKMINEAGFVIKAMKITKLSAEQAGAFYEVHKERPFYGSLVNFMSSGPIVAAILEKENAVEDYRKLIGATNPANAVDGTIRKLFAISMGKMPFMVPTVTKTQLLNLISFSRKPKGFNINRSRPGINPGSDLSENDFVD